MDTAESACNGLTQDVKMLHGNGQELQAERRCRLLKQFACVIIASMAQFSLGACLTWPSPALSDLAMNNKTLVGTELALTPGQMDMTGSLMSLGCLLGSLAGGAMVTRWGRRRSLQIVAVPVIIGCVALALAPNLHFILVARVLIGFGSAAACVASTLYVVEIVDAVVRGAMTTLGTLNIVLGGLYTVGLGCVVRWYYLGLVCAIPPSVLLIGTFFLPDSPALLVVRGNKHEALIVLRKLRGLHANLHSEIEMIEMKNSCQTSGWQKLLNWQMARQVAIVIMTFLFQHLCGNYVYIVHTARILRKTGIPWDADISTIIVAAARLVGSLVSISFVDRMGRRASLIVSYGITSVSLTTLGIFIFLAEAAAMEDTTFSRLAWVPLVCIIVALFGINVGAHPVPFILAAESFPTTVRGQTFSICYSSGMLFSFLALQTYSPMLEALTQPGLYWFYAGVSFIAVIYTYIFVEETKGRNFG